MSLVFRIVRQGRVLEAEVPQLLLGPEGHGPRLVQGGRAAARSFAATALDFVRGIDPLEVVLLVHEGRFAGQVLGLGCALTSAESTTATTSPARTFCPRSKRASRKNAETRGVISA